MTHPSPDLRKIKSDLRRIMQDKRAILCAENPEAPQQLRDQFLKEFVQLRPCTIAAYHARISEIDLAPLIEALHERGHRLSLPVILGRNQALVFRTYRPGDALIAGPMAILEPPATSPEAEPDMVLTPFLAFDRHYHRLGYGGGYYDRTLSMLRERKPLTVVGVGFAGQEIPQLPIGARDAPLDKIVTEVEVF